MSVRNESRERQFVLTLFCWFMCGILIVSCQSSTPKEKSFEEVIMESIEGMDLPDSDPDVSADWGLDLGDPEQVEEGEKPEESDPGDSESGEELVSKLKADPCNEKEEGGREYRFIFEYRCHYTGTLPGWNYEYKEVLDDENVKLYFSSIPGGKLEGFNSNRNQKMIARYSGQINIPYYTIPISGQRTVIVKDVHATCENDGTVSVELWLEYQEGELTCPCPEVGIDLCSDFESIGHQPILEPVFDLRKEKGFITFLHERENAGAIKHFCMYDFYMLLQ